MVTRVNSGVLKNMKPEAMRNVDWIVWFGLDLCCMFRLKCVKCIDVVNEGDTAAQWRGVTRFQEV